MKSLQKEQNDPKSAGINLQSPQSDSTPWTLTLEGTQFRIHFLKVIQEFDIFDHIT